MKKFDFSFQYLLDAHKAREEAAEHALHTAMKERLEARQTLEERQAYRARQVAVLQTKTGVVNRPEYATYLRSIDAIQRDMESMQQTIARFDDQILACRKTLKEEMTSRKVMENLREREREEWALDMQVEEQKQMDELAVGRWSRQVRKI